MISLKLNRPTLDLLFISSLNVRRKMTSYYVLPLYKARQRCKKPVSRTSLTALTGLFQPLEAGGWPGPTLQKKSPTSEHRIPQIPELVPRSDSPQNPSNPRPPWKASPTKKPYIMPCSLLLLFRAKEVNNPAVLFPVNLLCEVYCAV